MDSEQINIGIVGAGWIAAKAHAPILSRIRGVKCAAVLDTERDRAAYLAKQVGGLACEQLSQFDDLKLDAVVICTPTDKHYELAIHFLERGIHVLCEKPMTTSLQEAIDLRKVVERSRCVFMVGFVNRFRDDVQELRNRIQAGQLGKLQFCELSWRRKKGIPRPGSWFTTKQTSGGGVLTDLGSHMIDLMFYLLGRNMVPSACLCSTFSRPYDSIVTYTNWLGTAESGKIDVEDTAIGMIRLNDGMTVLLHVCWSDDVDGDFVRIHLKGTEGSLTLNTLFGFSDQAMYQIPNLIWVPRGLPSRHISLSGPVDPLIPFRRQAEYFIQCIREGMSADPSVDDGVRVVDVIDRLYRSAELRCVV